MRVSTLIIIIFLFVNINFGHAKSKINMLSQIPIYGIFELSLISSSEYSFTTAPKVNVTFTGLGGDALGKQKQIEGFWNGDSTFIIRFSPSIEGNWQYTTTSSDSSLNSKSGSFECSGRLPLGHACYHGHVINNSDLPYSFKFYDGTPFFLMGDTQWSFGTSAISWPDEFISYIDTRASQGFNYIHGVVYQTWPDGNDKNEGGQTFINNNPDNLNPDYWQAFDQRINYMNQKGIIVGFMLAWASDGWKNFASQSQVQRYVEYVIDRYGGYNLIWITAGEYEENEPPGGYEFLGNYLKNNDPYGHPITTHTINTSSDDFGSQEWHTIIYQQTPFPELITKDRKYNKPVINSEFGYEGFLSADEIRKKEWEIVMRGGFFVYGHEKTYHYDASMTSSNLNSFGALFSSNLYNFFTNNTHWWKMFPDNSLVNSGYCLANPSIEYIIYLPSGGEVVFNLSNTTNNLKTQWYNPRNNSTISDSTVPSIGENHFSAPDNEDWILHLHRINIDTIPPAPPQNLQITK